MKGKTILILLSAMMFTSCSEVLIEDYIPGTWELKMYLLNDVDATTEMDISNYEETYVLDGTYSRRYVDGKQQLVEEAGNFDINESEMSLHISDVSSISNFSAAHSTLSTSLVEVTTIDESEYVYTFENGGDFHEFRFIKKE